jgi:hypothetical protein
VVDLQFENAPPLVSRVRVEAQNLNLTGAAKVEIRELSFR